MKHTVVFFLCLGSILNGAEQLPNRPGLPIEYARGNKFQIDCFSHWLKKYNVPIKDQKVISFGCGTGEIELDLAQTAQSVHGIDASKEMIEYAQSKHCSRQKNLSFEHCFAENFASPTSYDLALASCCFHWFEDKPKAARAIANSLKSNGIFFANIETSSNPKPFGITVFEEMKRDVPIIGTLLAMLPNPTGSSHPDYGDLHVMLTEAGFTNIEPKIESYDWTMTAQEWRNAQLPLLLSTPGAQKLVNSTSENNSWGKTASEWAFWLINMSPEEKEEHGAPFFPESNHELVEKIRKNDFCRYLFNNFLRRCLAKLEDNGGTYTWKYETTIILAQKK